jgi:hypothetical protein
MTMRGPSDVPSPPTAGVDQGPLRSGARRSDEQLYRRSYL